MTQPYPPQPAYGPPPQQPYGGPPAWGPPSAYGPPPGQYQAPPPPPRKPRFGTGARIGIAVLGLFLVGAISNAGKDDRPSTPRVPVAAAAPVVPAADQPAPAPEPAPAAAFPGSLRGDVTGEAGATLVLDELSITAAALDEGDSTFGETLCATVSYVNGGTDAVSFGAFDWSMQNPSGAIVTITFFGGAGDFLPSGELAPGGRTSGEVCFEDANPSSGQYVLLYDPPSFFSADRLAWLDER